MRYYNTRFQFAPTLASFAALGLLACASAGHAQTLGLNFTGITGSNLAPPDTNGAVGTTQIAEFVNGAYEVWDKTTGGVVSAKITDAKFWNNAGISTAVTNTGLSDTKIIFDPNSSRWFATELTTPANSNKILVAVSKSADITAGFTATSYAAAGTSFGDYDTLSLDTNGVYISTNNFTSSSGSYTGNSTLTSIPKADLLQATPSIANASTFTLSASTYGFTLQGAYDTGAGTGAIVGVSNTSATQLKKFNINGSGAAGATLSTVTTTNVSAYSQPVQASQPDGTKQISTGDDRISAKPVKMGNNIVLAHSLTVGSNTGIRITVLNATTGALISEKTISAAGFDYYYPSLAINASGQVIVGYNRSSTAAGQFIGSYMQSGSLSGAGILSLSGSDFTLKAGTANYHLFGGTGERWGDYSTSMVDPTDPTSFWTFQEAALGGTGWSTQITQIKLASTPAPSSLLVVAGGVIPGLMALRRKRRK